MIQKQKVKKYGRWQTIAEVASKQCKRDFITKINNVIDLKNICNIFEEYDIVLVAYENEEINSLKKEIENLKGLNKKDIKIAIVIGPEGGIEEEEISILQEKGAKIITLGKRILRTETVALVMSGIIMYELGDLGGN